LAHKKKLSFEQQVARLEEIVTILDRGTAPIEELLRLYQEGMSLSQQCRTYLTEAEQKVVLIDRQNVSLNDKLSNSDRELDTDRSDDFDDDRLPNSTLFSLDDDDF